METFFEKVAEIITASSTRLGLVALMVIVVAFLAYFFFKQESAQTKKKIFAGIVGLLFVLALVVLLLPESNPSEPEPPEPDSPFYTMENVYLTSHIAGSLNDEVVRMADFMIEEFGRYDRGEDLLHEVSVDMIDTMA